MKPNSVIPVIESNYSNMTGSEKIVARYFLKAEKKDDFSARCVAEKTNVSEATLSRFAKKCGYRGYREFLYAYEKKFEEKPLNITKQSLSILTVYEKLVERMHSLLDEQQVSRIVQLLKNSRRIFICGKGSSGYAADELAVRFMRIGLDISALQDGDVMRMQTVFRDEGSLVFGISLSGKSREVLYFLEESHKRKAKTILITANNKKEFYEYCDEVVLVPALKYLNHGDTISPQFPILLFMDIVYTAYIYNDKRVKALHDKTLQALEKMD